MARRPPTRDFRSLCALNGRHTPDSEWAKECPLNPEQMKKRSDRTKRGNETRRKNELLISSRQRFDVTAPKLGVTLPEESQTRLLLAKSTTISKR